MGTIESVICLILLLMAVPDLCQKLGRPALANGFFVVFGILLQGGVSSSVTTMLVEAGKVGFLLVLFEVGLEIDLPRFRVFLRPLSYAAMWSVLQFPVLFALCTVAGLNLAESLLATAALTSCSMSMAYFGWKQYPGLSEAARSAILQIMVALEMLGIVLLAVGAPMLKGVFEWTLLLQLAGIGITIFLISRFASRVTNLFQWVIEKSTHWRVHFLILLVLVICAVGERLGLSAAKTAFFLGLFMSRAHVQQHSLEEHIAPISRRFLIPIFFVSLGLLVDRGMLFSYSAGLALCGAMLLLGFREMIYRRWLKIGGDSGSYLLLSPNLTIAALAATSMLAAGSRDAGTWTLMTGLFISMLSLFLLPRSRKGAAEG